jgi:hypothetical protein
VRRGPSDSPTRLTVERAEQRPIPAAPPDERPGGVAPEAASSAAPRVPHRGPDRRGQPTPRLSRYALWGGRRREVRRTEDREGSFVDQYSGRLFVLMVWIGLMNIGDSFFTLFHLQAGGIELNPFAALLLGTGRTGFVVAKSLLISIPLLVLCLHKNFSLARIGLWVAASCYSVLFLYHLYLL